MSSLSKFYKDLLSWENQEYRKLVFQWPEDLREEIVQAFIDAVSDSSIKGSVCPVKAQSSN